MGGGSLKEGLVSECLAGDGYRRGYPLIGLCVTLWGWEGGLLRLVS